MCSLHTLPRFASNCAYTAEKAATADIAPRVRKADAEAVRIPADSSVVVAVVLLGTGMGPT